MLLLVAIVIGLALIKALALWSSRQAPLVGLAADGRLAPCPPTPNAVNSEDPVPGRRVAPLPYRGSPERTRAAFRAWLADAPRLRLVTTGDDYLHGTVSTRIFGFVDDVEFRFADEERVIHCRSASRVGQSDLGANRRRLAQWRAAWLAQEAAAVNAAK